ncbi:MAG: hypothetical protein BEN18_06930 [Epulopiscium sp. Nuni2H_MBin001]|nr:MAG: hypothetical protein BEN18_06930 [Epulopiscium sp. Nuni2H_MBin001]
MKKFYTAEEFEQNKVLKSNLAQSDELLKDSELNNVRANADANIASSEELLKSLGYSKEVLRAKTKAMEVNEKSRIRGANQLWENIVKESNEYVPHEVMLEDILSESEIKKAFKELDRINHQFSKKTSITNKTDLIILTIAIALQVTKSVLFPYLARKFGYGDSFDKTTRLSHDDSTIKQAQKAATDEFRDKYINTYGTGAWVNFLYQTPAYDVTFGSKNIGINMEGMYHRFHTLGHDPILGWVFGTANILTDTITLNNFTSYRIIRTPTMTITPEQVSIFSLFNEAYGVANANFLNLPAALFAQAQHLNSDAYTKLGLPVPMLSVINESLASKLYKNQYDALCFARDARVIEASYIVSMIIDMLISLLHGIFRTADDDIDLYEIRTRKILLISNAIASGSTIIATSITQNIKNLDIGSLLSTITHLFFDIRFISKIKKEYIKTEIDAKLKTQLEEINRLYNSI